MILNLFSLNFFSKSINNVLKKCNIFFVFALLLGSFFRFYNLTAKPLWTDEFATLVFSLGNSYHSIALDKLIDIQQLLEPLKYNNQASIKDIVSLLITEDNHPPLYFIIAYYWNKLWQNNNEYISIFTGRSLSAILGIISIPLSYYLTKITLKSSVIANYSAWLIAVSAFGIYLAQEARHYTLAIILILISFFGLLTLIRYFYKNKQVPFSLTVSLLLINILGILTHYFFLIFLAIEFIVVISIIISNKYIKITKKFISLPEKFIYSRNFKYWLSKEILLLSFLIYWFTIIIPQDYGNNMTAWIETNSDNIIAIISPIFQLLATIITMIALLPVESSNLIIVIISALIMLLFFRIFIPLTKQGLTNKEKSLDLQLSKYICIYTLIISILIFLGITYILGLDITRGARYSFVYFPIVIILISICLFSVKITQRQAKNIKIMIAVMGIASALTVTSNLGYQKYYRPDLLIPVINNYSRNQIIIATAHQTLVQTGEMMGIAHLIFNNKLDNLLTKTKFLLAHQNYPNDEGASEILKANLREINQPIDLWLVNFYAPVNIEKCLLSEYNESFIPIDGYNYQLYHCNGKNKNK